MCNMIFAPPPASLFSHSRLPASQGTRLKPGCKFWSRPGSMACALGVQGREMWKITTGRHSEQVEPSRPIQTHVQVQNMSDGLRMFRIQLTPHSDCLATSCSCWSAPLSGCTLARDTAHTACFHLSGCTRSSFLCGNPCVNTGAISTAAWKNCLADFCFPNFGWAGAAGW